MKQFSGQIDVVEICTDDLAEASADCGVVSIPTIQFYYRGELLDTIVGCVARSVLASAVTKVLDDTTSDSGTNNNDDSPRDVEESL
jgi:thioredoxin-like negative regulator of GroEL